MKKQCFDIIKMRKDLDARIIEVQLKHLDTEIKECKSALESDSFSEEDYRRYEALKKEKDALIQENEEFL